MKKRIFSLLLMAIMIVTCFVTGCSAARKTSSASSASTRSVKKVKNIGRMKSNVDIRRYLYDMNMGRNPDGESNYQLLDLKAYLIANGATDIWHSEDHAIMCKFNNNIFIAFTFWSSDSNYSYPLLSTIYIVAGKDDYHPMCIDDIQYGNMEGNDLVSSWVREVELPRVNEENTEDDDIVIPHKNYFVRENFDSERSVEMIPWNFDTEFKRSIRPYLDLDEVSLEKDSVSEDDEIGGFSFNHKS